MTVQKLPLKMPHKSATLLPLSILLLVSLTQAHSLAAAAAASTSALNNNFVRYHGDNITLSTPAVASNQRIICRDRDVRPRFHRVWYGLPALGQYERCSDVPEEVSST